MSLSTSYVHLGIKNETKKVSNMKEVTEKINKMKACVYSLVGTSLSYSSLSPKALSKLYWSVGIHQLITGCEVRFFNHQELSALEKAHRGMVKSIQCLPDNTPDPMCLAMLGWLRIQTYIEKLKMLFFFAFCACHMIVYLEKYLYYVSIKYVVIIIWWILAQSHKL